MTENAQLEKKMEAAFAYAEEAFKGEHSSAPDDGGSGGAPPIVVGRAYVRVNNGPPEIGLMSAIDGARTGIRGMLTTQRHGAVVIDKNDHELQNWRMLPLQLLLTPAEMEDIGQSVITALNKENAELRGLLVALKDVLLQLKGEVDTMRADFESLTAPPATKATEK